jgi:hypothetical protein
MSVQATILKKTCSKKTAKGTKEYEVSEKLEKCGGGE